MKNFFDDEGRCSQVFHDLGECYHLWTSENFEMIFCSDDDYRAGMNIMGICARLFPEIKILTFELMSNHIHFAIAGERTIIHSFFDAVKKYLSRHFRKLGRVIDWSGFNARTRELLSTEDVRNVIIYNNRNGYVVSKNYTPFTYPWGANRFYFSPDSVSLAEIQSRPMTLRERQSGINGRKADNVAGLLMYEGCVSPLSFCEIALGERLFRSPSQYFYKLGRSIEAQKDIARDISESVFYTDDELFSAISSIARKKYFLESVSEAGAAEKLELAKTMRYEYNASAKQIMRFLKLSNQVLASIGIN